MQGLNHALYIISSYAKEGTAGDNPPHHTQVAPILSFWWHAQRKLLETGAFTVLL